MALHPRLTQAIDDLYRGSWVLDVFGPVFQQALQEHASRLGVTCTEQITLPVLASLRYGRIAAAEASSAFAGTIRTSHTLAITMHPRSGFFRQASELIDEGLEVVTPTDAFVSNINTALEMIAQASPDTAGMLSRWISALCIVQGGRFRSASHPHTFGVIFMSDRRSEDDALEIATSIVHELAHHELFLLNLFDRLVPDDADYRLAHAPFQGRERPPIGRLHAAHALYRMALLNDQLTEGARASHYRDIMTRTCATFKPGELTPFATQICREVYLK